MRGKLTAYLQLIRLPNVLTAAADSLAGWLLGDGLAGRAGCAGCRWSVASMVLYASGTALNDVFDFEDRPRRAAGPPPALRPGLDAIGRVARRPGLAARPGAGAGERLGLPAAIVAAVLAALHPGL